MDEKQLKELTDSINAKIDRFNDDLHKKAAVDTLEAKHKELVDMIAKLPASEDVKKMQDQLDAMDVKMQTALVNTPQGQKTVADQLKDALKSDDFRAASKIRGRQYDFDIKANELTTSNSFTETNGAVIARMYEPGVIAPPLRPTPVWDLISKGSISSDFVIQTERSTETIGASATHVSEAGAFGQSYAGWTTYVWGVNKIPEYIKVAREKLEDWEYVRGEVMDMLTNNIPHIREGKFLTGYNATQVWLGIINTTSQVAKDFAVPTGFNPVAQWNYFDVLRAAMLQVEVGDSATRTSKSGFQANAALLHPVDVVNLQMTKDVNGNYIRPMWADGYLTIGGLRIIPTLNMTQSKFLVGDFAQAKAWVSRALNINMWDQNSTDPIYDLVTFTASHRLAFGIGAVKAFAFVYGDFDTAGPLIAA